jgi:hypothetical protein
VCFPHGHLRHCFRRSLRRVPTSNSLYFLRWRYFFAKHRRVFAEAEWPKAFFRDPYNIGNAYPCIVIGVNAIIDTVKSPFPVFHFT